MKLALKAKSIILFYLFFLIAISVLPINSKESKLNHTFILQVRGDYFFHSLVFLPWMLLLLLDSSQKSLQSRFYQPLNWVLFGLVFAFFTESIQYFLSYRTFNINDMASNFIGLIIGFSLYLLIRFVKSTRTY